MIMSFADSEAELVYHQQFSRKLPQNIQKRALVKLMLLDTAATEKDLLNPPGNLFEHLSGSKERFCSIRINDQWRITFEFIEGNAHNVKIEDYH
jgi:proteic killer suppression protein